MERGANPLTDHRGTPMIEETIALQRATDIGRQAPSAYVRIARSAARAQVDDFRPSGGNQRIQIPGRGLEVEPDMACYLVSYDLRQPQRNYGQLYGAIKSYGTWAHINESLWAVVTTQSAVQVREHLIQFIDANDRLFVVKSGVEAAWRNVICKNEWLKEHL